MKKIIIFLFLLICLNSNSQTITNSAELRTRINQWIVPNSQQQITAQRLNLLLNGQLNVFDSMLLTSIRLSSLSATSPLLYNNLTGVFSADTGRGLNKFATGGGLKKIVDSLGEIIESKGTVKSVAATVPTGFSISGSPITTSGTLGITYASGYSLPTTASQSLWDVAYTNRITSLTTTGSSGAATLSSNTLNIPTPTVSGLGGIDSIRLVNTGVIFTTPAAFVKSATTGVITQTLATQTANKVLASPNGSSGTPTFRSLVNADLPKRIDSTEKTLPSGLITFTGTTAPSGTTYNTYEWSQNGRVVTFRLNLSYSVAASGITAVVISIPTDMPTPTLITDPLTPGTNDVLIPLSCNGGNTRTIINLLNANINRNGGTPAIRMTCSAQNIQYLQIAGSYFTNN